MRGNVIYKLRANSQPPAGYYKNQFDSRQLSTSQLVEPLAARCNLRHVGAGLIGPAAGAGLIHSSNPAPTPHPCMFHLLSDAQMSQDTRVERDLSLTPRSSSPSRPRGRRPGGRSAPGTASRTRNPGPAGGTARWRWGRRRARRRCRTPGRA
jgi:hypothetical protein